MIPTQRSHGTGAQFMMSISQNEKCKFHFGAAAKNEKSRKELSRAGRGERDNKVELAA
jgi:hypothetical protein